MSSEKDLVPLIRLNFVDNRIVSDKNGSYVRYDECVDHIQHTTEATEALRRKLDVALEALEYALPLVKAMDVHAVLEIVEAAIKQLKE